MSHSRPAASHIRRVFEPAVYKIVEVFHRRFYFHAGKNISVFRLHGSKRVFRKFHGRRNYLVFRKSGAYYITDSMFFFGRKLYLIFKSKAKLFGIAFGIKAPGKRRYRLRMLVVSVRSDERISSRIISENFLG